MSRWYDQAACRGQDPQLWFNDTHNVHAHEQARAICFGRCPVREACLADAIRCCDEYGVRGGLTAKERRRDHKKQMDAVKEAKRTVMVHLAVEHRRHGGTAQTFGKKHGLSRGGVDYYMSRARAILAAEYPSRKGNANGSAAA